MTRPTLPPPFRPVRFVDGPLDGQTFDVDVRLDELEWVVDDPLEHTWAATDAPTTIRSREIARYRITPGLRPGPDVGHLA